MDGKAIFYLFRDCIRLLGSSVQISKFDAISKARKKHFRPISATEEFLDAIFALGKDLTFSRPKKFTLCNYSREKFYIWARKYFKNNDI